jgi:hypothetical protein
MRSEIAIGFAKVGEIAKAIREGAILAVANNGVPYSNHGGRDEAGL